MRWITPRELNSLLSSETPCLVVDIRETYETKICQIPSLHIPMAEIAERYMEIPKDKSIVIMCKTGKRAEATANLMECELGFSDLYILEGGILGWIAEIDSQLEVY
jgi:rhodanese-related sulfurtransferase|tara:strand:- start:21799 stop:22116 length:318 start_codon:yes stop_codon:yes gene_type:complete